VGLAYLLHEVEPVTEPAVLTAREQVPVLELHELPVRLLRHQPVVAHLRLQSKHTHTFRYNAGLLG